MRQQLEDRDYPISIWRIKDYIPRDGKKYNRLYIYLKYKILNEMDRRYLLYNSEVHISTSFLLSESSNIIIWEINLNILNIEYTSIFINIL